MLPSDLHGHRIGQVRLGQNRVNCKQFPLLRCHHTQQRPRVCLKLKAKALSNKLGLLFDRFSRNNLYRRLSEGLRVVAASLKTLMAAITFAEPISQTTDFRTVSVVKREARRFPAGLLQSSD